MFWKMFDQTTNNIYIGYEQLLSLRDGSVDEEWYGLIEVAQRGNRTLRIIENKQNVPWSKMHKRFYIAHRILGEYGANLLIFYPQKLKDADRTAIW